MICPICGFEMQDEKTCEKCGFTVKENDQTQEEETVVDFEALEKVEVDLEEVDEVDETDDTEEDDVLLDDEDLTVDFDEIDNMVLDKKSSKAGLFVSSFISFVAGVLATLVVIGCLNGTIISYFDRITNGSPNETVESFCKFYFMDEPSADDMVETFSPYLRSKIVSELEYYNSNGEVDLNIDVNDNKKFKDVAEYYIDLVSQSNTQKTDITSIEFTDVEYYKSGSDEFNNYMQEYKSVDKDAKGVSLFANVSFTIKFDVTTVEEETNAIPETTKKNNKSETTTKAPKTKTESMVYKCSVVCVKINDNWCVYNGLQVLS